MPSHLATSDPTSLHSATPSLPRPPSPTFSSMPLSFSAPMSPAFDAAVERSCMETQREETYWEYRQFVDSVPYTVSPAFPSSMVPPLDSAWSDSFWRSPR